METNKIHGHEVLRMMEGNSYTLETLHKAIIEKFGEKARFYTCSAKDLDAAGIIQFLQKKGKFMPTNEGELTMDISQVCNAYINGK